jgi:hypothetical protein
VIFTSIRTEGDDGYAATADEMAELAAQQPGYSASSPPATASASP